MSNEERWAPIPGFEGSYDVSDQGRVRSRDRLNSVGRMIYGKIKQLTPNKDGYLTVSLFSSGHEYRRQVHRLVLEAFVGPAPDGLECLHGPDRNPANCQLTNLRWGTRSANNSDRVGWKLSPAVLERRRRRAAEKRNSPASEPVGYEDAGLTLREDIKERG